MKGRQFSVVLLAFLMGIGAQAQGQRVGRNSVKMALTGDSIVNRHFSVFKEPGFLEVVRILREADFAFTNFETLIPNGKGYPRHPPTGIYMDSPPVIADDLVWMGIDAVNLAHNHAADYSKPALIETYRILMEAGLPPAGFGMNLAQARAPAYIETANGRVALIGMWATDYYRAELHRAGVQGRSIRGRPGTNVLRLETDYTVDQETFDAFKENATRWGIPWVEETEPVNTYATRDGTRPAAAKFGFGPGTKLTIGPTRQVRKRAFRVDEDGVMMAIKEARGQADWVVVTIHDGGEEFHRTFAKTCIDAGADVFLAHGDHRMHGVEIYKGKPIFYGTGDLFLENETVNPLPYEEYEMYALDDNKLTPRDFYDNRLRNPDYFAGTFVNWQNVIAVPEWQDGELSEITFHPITLGFETPRSQRGRPMMADPDLGKKIIERLREMSEHYGTEIAYEDGVGRWIKPSSQN
jgi:poly-gamma-glutamate capsule biosynthesis protein CapA/YwtB (metallophosphatase superfamily)